jgi:hypothetical protein
LRKTDGEVDWCRPAQAIKNQIRALEPWPRSYTFWHRATGSPVRLILGRCEVVDRPGTNDLPGTVVAAAQELLVATDSDALKIHEVQPAGKRMLTAAEFLRGYPVQSGDQFGPEHDRRGTTRLNVIVAILAIGFLLSLTLPAIQGSRDLGRRNSCGCHGKRLATSVAILADVNGGRYPGYLNTLKFDEPVTRPDGSVADDTGVSWVVPLLPFLAEDELFRQWSNGDVVRKSRTANDPVANGYLVLVCPSSRASAPTPPPCNYVVNTGRRDVRARGLHGDSPRWPADWAANGVFFNRYVDGRANPTGAPLVEVTHQYIADHDGSTRTLMLSERLDAGSYAVLPQATETEVALGFIWWPFERSQPVPRSRRINGPHHPVAIYNARLAA